MFINMNSEYGFSLEGLPLESQMEGAKFKLYIQSIVGTKPKEEALEELQGLVISLFNQQQVTKYLCTQWMKDGGIPSFPSENTLNKFNELGDS